MPPLGTASIDGAAENALASAATLVSIATIHPAPPSLYAPNGTYRRFPSGLRLRAPRCDIADAGWKRAGPFWLIDCRAPSSIVTGHRGRTSPLRRSSAKTFQAWDLPPATSAATYSAGGV